jgi:hypothetical protein
MPAGPSGGIANVAAAGRRTTPICPRPDWSGDDHPATRRSGRLIRRRDDVDPGRAESRVSAYVYGNVLVLAAVVGASPATVASGAAVAVGAGPRLVRRGGPDRATGVVHRRLREDVPLRKAWTVGALAAGVAAVAVVLKLTLTH